MRIVCIHACACLFACASRCPVGVRARVHVCVGVCLRVRVRVCARMHARARVRPSRYRPHARDLKRIGPQRSSSCGTCNGLISGLRRRRAPVRDTPLGSELCVACFVQQTYLHMPCGKYSMSSSRNAEEHSAA